jgi:replicative DNA helicase
MNRDTRPPASLEAEKALLSSLFIDSEKILAVSDIVTAGCFYTTKHSQIYSAIKTLHAAGEAIEVLTVHGELKRQKVDIALSELQKIASYYPTAEIAEKHAEIVLEKHIRRAAIATMQQAVISAQDEGQNVRDIISTVQKALDDSLPGDRKASDIYPEIIDVWEQIVDMTKGGEKNYIETGFYDLDEAVTLANGTLTIVGAAPRVGKTSFFLCAMRNIVKQGKRPLMFTLEMTRERILQNIIAQDMQVSHQDMIKGRLSEEKQAEITRAAGRWGKLNIGVLDNRSSPSKHWSASEIRNRVLREIREKGADIVFIDALGKMPPPETMGRAKKHEYFEANTELLSNLAIEANIPVILAHHLNREGAKDGSKPTLFALNEAGEKYADNVILMHRDYLINPTPENKGLADYIVPKSRDGDINSVELGWHGATKTFFSLTKNPEPVMAGGRQWGN